MMLQHRRTKMVWLVFLGLFAGTGTEGTALAGQVLYASSFAGQEIVSVDVSTNIVTPIVHTPGNPDSLLFDGSNIIYTDEKNGELREVSLTTHVDSVLSNQFIVPADLTLTPGGQSVLVSDFSAGKIIKYDFQTQTSSVFARPGGNPEGLVFDPTGRLFANLGDRFGGPTGKFVAQLDPVTGAILHTSPGLNSLDGLTYDSTTGLLYATSRLSGAVYSIDPNNLANARVLIPAGILNTPDGITSDGMGDLFIAVQGDSRIYEYNLISGALTPETIVPGTIDDLAPASGLGSVREPSALLMLSIGALVVIAYGCWRSDLSA